MSSVEWIESWPGVFDATIGKWPGRVRLVVLPDDEDEAMTNILYLDCHGDLQRIDAVTPKEAQRAAEQIIAARLREALAQVEGETNA